MSRRTSTGLAFLVEDRPAEAFEQLDSVLRIVSIRNWFFIALLFAILAGFGIFACLYRAPLKVDGRGILLTRFASDDSPILQITAPAAGRLRNIRVKIGDRVEKEQLIAEIDQSDLRDQIEEAEAELASRIEEDRVLTQFDENEAKLRVEALGKLETTLLHNLELDEKRLGDHKRALQRNRSLRERQYLSDLEALKSQADSDAVESAVGSTRAKLDELKYDRFEDRSKREKDKTKRALDINRASTKLSLLSQRLERDTRVVSPYPGKIVDLMITEHALVEKGAPTVLLRAESPKRLPMEAIVFVPAGQGKKVKVGHLVEITPDTVRRQEHGFIRGEVTKISEIPATEMAMMAELKHKDLVKTFLDQYDGQAILCIHVNLRELPSSGGDADPPRFDWSSSSGRDQIVTTGTLCGASIVVDSRRLIALVFPWLKDLSGIY
ncbi:MAG: NHLP bacteriocin system secretion protein [Isosphaeraceae bacterium]